jgi:Ni/Co efflux regulator RcnB
MGIGKQSMEGIKSGPVVALAFALAVCTGPAAWADPPGGFEKGKGHERDAGPRENDRRSNEEHGARESHFQDRDHVAVREYFEEAQRGGRCPPGLAKKHDGCMPPGQAKRWHVGERLPRDVVFYDLPPSLVVRLTPPPMGYRYVRVDSDIVMLAVGTGLVAEAIEDLGRR